MMVGDPCSVAGALTAAEREPGQPVQVLRHGGRWGDCWRLVGKTDAAFWRHYQRVRQGALALVTNGQLGRYYNAPNVRTRW